MICISASVVSKNVFIPATPKHTIVYITDGAQSLIDMKNYIETYRLQGYMVKSTSFGVGSRSAGGIVVMEKY